MPKTRKQKEEIVSQVAEKFKRMKTAAFTSISGYTMAQADELRKRAHEANADVFITKKTLLAHALKEAGLVDVDATVFAGSILTAVSYDDEVTAAKLLKNFQKDNDAFVLEAGILEGKGIGKDEVNKLASLPSKHELLARLVGSINAPVSGFVNVLAGNIRGLVTVLDAIKSQKS